MSKINDALKSAAKKTIKFITAPCTYKFELNQDDFTNLVQGKVITKRKGTSNYGFELTMRGMSAATLIAIINDNLH